MNSEAESLSCEAAPYAGLTPDCVLAALDSVGLHGDGRLLALNSYENRVYQIGLAAPPIAGLETFSADVAVAKFYRPHRWSDAAIAEEHAFVGELAEREIPVIAPLSLAGVPAIDAAEENFGTTTPCGTLHTFAGFRFAVYPKCAGRSPELDDRNTLQWMGRFIGRIHAVGALHSFTARPRLDIETFGDAPRLWLLAHDFVPADLLPAWRSVS
ncbi:MAG: serine/threonine protein kinase, partial [Burkholderiales bacterium]|nr:serine/threonine protein kinase [Burkholderiales bacterium]